MRVWASIVVLTGFLVMGFGSGEGEVTSGSSADSSPACERCKERCQEANAIPDRVSDEMGFAELVAAEYEILHACGKECASVCE